MKNISGKPSSDGQVYLGGVAFRVNQDGSGLRPIGHNFRNSYEQAVSSLGDVFQNDNDDPPASRTAWLMEYGNMGFTSRNGLRKWSSDKMTGQTTQVAEWRQEDPESFRLVMFTVVDRQQGLPFMRTGSWKIDSEDMLLVVNPLVMFFSVIIPKSRERELPFRKGTFS